MAQEAHATPSSQAPKGEKTMQNNYFKSGLASHSCCCLFSDASACPVGFSPSTHHIICRENTAGRFVFLKWMNPMDPIP